MKRKVFYTPFAQAILIALLFTTVACNKYLSPDPVSSFNPAYVFSNVQNAKGALLGAYQGMIGDNGYGIRISMYYPYDNDEMIGLHQVGDNDRGDIAHFSVTTSNPQLLNPWNQMYAGIEKSNICIHYIPLMDMYSNGTAQQKAQLQRMYGEALTLRAQYYLEIIRNWGDVPAQYQPSAFESDLFKAKTDRDSIYTHVIADLLTAEGLVPWRTDIPAIGDPSDERITKGSVKALRAKIALFRGGYSLRRASSSYGQVMARPADYKAYYQIAKDECADLMARRDQHTLNPSYQGLFQNYIDGHTADPVGEVIFRVGMAGGAGSTDSKLGYYDGPKVTSTVTTNAAIGVLPTYFYLFDSTDLRRDVTCAPYEVNADQTLKGHPITTIAEAKFRKDWINNPSVFTTAAQYNGIDWPLIRFSDVLLMYAEADNEINGAPSATALAAIKEVSQRGHGGNAALVPTFPSDHDGFFAAVVKERSLELGGEGIRKYDLIRWNLMATRLADAKANITAMSGRGTATFAGNYSFNSFNFANVPDSLFYKTTSTITTGIIWGTSFYTKRVGISAITGFTKILWASSAIANVLATGSSGSYAAGFTVNHSELFPIPQAVKDADPKLTQDYGY